jgi:hypothetical protein
LASLFAPESGHAVRWRGQSYPLRFADVALELSDGLETCQWSAVVAVSQAPLRYPILGICGCLQFFNARFLGDDRIAELEANQSYPGTIT